MSDYSNPLAQLSFLPNYRSHAKAFTIEEDRWLLCMISKYVLRSVLCSVLCSVLRRVRMLGFILECATARS